MVRTGGFDKTLLNEESETYQTQIQENPTKKSYFFSTIYYENEKEFLIWSRNNFSKCYSTNVINNLKKIIPKIKDFEEKRGERIEKSSEILKLIDKNELNYERSVKGLRNLFNFLEKYEILDEVYLNELRKKLKFEQNYTPDLKIPKLEDVKKTYCELKEFSYLHSLVYRIHYFSGLRVNEVSTFLHNLDISKFEVHDNVVSYPLFHMRGKKNSYYLLLDQKTHKEILKYKDNLSVYNVGGLKTYIKRHKLVALKYLRKFQYDFCVKFVDYTTLDFIAGRTPKSVSQSHYMNMKNKAIYEYEKVIAKLEENIYK